MRFQAIQFNLNHNLKCLQYTGKMTSLHVTQASIHNVMCILSLSFLFFFFRTKAKVENIFHYLFSSYLTAYNTTHSIQQQEMETEPAFSSWFNLAVTPIADALKWLRRIVSAWRDLQLGSTSAPAAAPQYPLNLQIIVLVGSQQKQFQLHNCEYFYEMDFNWAIG